MTNRTVKLTVGGPVQAQNGGTYVSRPADNALLNACKAGDFAYVLACRQIGKSSLMFATSQKLAGEGVRTALIDLNSIGHSSEADSWYFSLLDEVARKLKLEVNLETWWDERPRLSTLTHRFLQFLREIVLEQIPESIVIFIDEIDMTLGLSFTNDFFAAIRAVHNERAQISAYRRLTFVLLGVATPDELINDPLRTPFNIGQAITLRDFTREECEPFCRELEAAFPIQGSTYFDQIYEWTNGHPYLTQKLCDAVLRAGANGPEAPRLVDEVVRKIFLAAEARSEDNLQFVQTRVTGDPYAQEMLKIYRRVLEQSRPVYDDEQSPAINRLKLYGLIVVKNGALQVRNTLYARVFDRAWTGEMLRLSSATVRLGLPERYKILQEIGQGGFSTVYLAQLEQAEQTQSVALKVLRTHNLDDDSQIRRFKQEARTVAKLKHPNIIRILETGGDEDTFFIAMEYISHGTLRDLLKAGPLPRNEAVHIVRSIGSALALAHAQGIIHRDIKPENILLDMSQEPMRPVLTDFGLIKIFAETDYTKIHSTAILGTLDYMAPEQWRQDTLSPATDLYALALNFYEMLTGRRPFSGNSPFELMDKHTKEPLPRLSSVAPEIGPFFDDILSRAVAKDPAGRFSSITDFLAALETANDEAEQVARVRQQEQATKTVEVALGYIQKSRYDPEKALSMIEVALDLYPDYAEALRLRGKIRLQQGQIDQALQDYRQAYAQEQNPASEVGREYLEILGLNAEMSWQHQQYEEAVKDYETIQEILKGYEGSLVSLQEMRQQARSRLVEYHHHLGNVAYASGKPDDLAAAVEILARQSGLLAALKADREREDLQEKLHQLQIKKYQVDINTAQTAIDETNAKSSHARFANEEIFHHYLTLDQAYQALIELEPDNSLWVEERRKKLKERAETRAVFAMRALNKPEPEYEAALRHYKAILDIDKAGYPGIAHLLNLNLEQKIIDLEKKADHDGKYRDIQKLIESGDYLKALERLDNDFICERNYEHREVARLLWGLVYAKQHEGKFPPEWDSMSGFEILSKRIISVERERTRILKTQLEPWTQSKILETIDRENKRLGGFEAHLKHLGATLDEVGSANIAAQTEVTQARQALAALQSRIQAQRDVFFHIDVNATTRTVSSWLQNLEEAESLLQTGNPVKDFQEYLSRIDETQQAIEYDAMLESLKTATVTSAEIGREIEQTELQIRERLIGALLDDIDRRKKQFGAVEQELTQATADLAQARTAVTEVEEKLDEARRRESALQAEVAELEKRHEVFGVSLIPALVIGAVIGILLTMITASVQNVTWLVIIVVGIALIWGGWVYRRLTDRSDQ